MRRLYYKMSNRSIINDSKKSNKSYYQFSDDQIMKIHEVFDLFDVNKDGFIPESGIHAALCGLGIYTTKNEIYGIICIDTHGTKAVNFQQFKQYVSKFMNDSEMRQITY